MVLHRACITRIVAAILTLALSTQVAEAQMVNCIVAGAAQPNDDHGAMTQQQHQAYDTGAATHSRGSHHQRPGTACTQTMLCTNAPAIPTAAMRSIRFNNAEPPISFGSDALEARALHPDPPPPKNLSLPQ